MPAMAGCTPEGVGDAEAAGEGAAEGGGGGMATPPEMRTTSPPSPDFEGGSDTPGDGAGLLLLPSGAAWGEAAGGTVSPADVVL